MSAFFWSHSKWSNFRFIFNLDGVNFDFLSMGKEKEIWGKYKHFRYPMKFLICSFILTFLYIIITLGIRMSSNVSISFDRNETLSNLNKLHNSNDLQRTCGLFILLASMSKNFVFTCGSIHLIFTKFDLFFFFCFSAMSFLLEMENWPDNR